MQRLFARMLNTQNAIMQLPFMDLLASKRLWSSTTYRFRLDIVACTCLAESQHDLLRVILPDSEQQISSHGPTILVFLRISVHVCSCSCSEVHCPIVDFFPSSIRPYLNLLLQGTSAMILNLSHVAIFALIGSVLSRPQRIPSCVEGANPFEDLCFDKVKAEAANVPTKQSDGPEPSNNSRIIQFADTVSHSAIER